MIVAVLLGGAGAGVVGLSRRRLSDAQLLAALVGAQLAYQVAYAVPGVCAVVGEPSGLASATGHATVSGAPPEAFLVGHLVTLVLTARLLGVAERLLWHTQPVLASIEALWLLFRPLPATSGTGPTPKARASRNDALPPSALVIGLNDGRAPPRAGHGLHGRAPHLVRAAARRWSPYALVA
ncbi:hypothetical protein [Streptomyces sp. NPDC001927]